MRTTIELPDDLLRQAKTRAAASAVSLRQFFIEAVQQKLAGDKRKVRRDPPAIGSMDDPPMQPLTREQIDEAMFG